MVSIDAAISAPYAAKMRGLISIGAGAGMLWSVSRFSKRSGPGWPAKAIRGNAVSAVAMSSADAAYRQARACMTSIEYLLQCRVSQYLRRIRDGYGLAA